uniref:Uncharacterized protein n=1 Tax=Chromera velia CCMP2878 TaxID=1169474 RepID=A0A0G4G4I5_9ALVE|eukprot:Cvel_559.t1-p1 / transcript=Cvel_559.t1 / gene=Cvel_559 / organism=Chromera_velia_CCMP2878 / gene_product=hypothetical protein / transcript_product=hypothetical protein / location=Cvel_scaffold17:129442-129897(-) / protein_length=88 / sequence_SO=supercontig / SO=protein_coding / is_pseudo=false
MPRLYRCLYSEDGLLSGSQEGHDGPLDVEVIVHHDLYYESVDLEFWKRLAFYSLFEAHLTCRPPRQMKNLISIGDGPLEQHAATYVSQ